MPYVREYERTTQYITALANERPVNTPTDHILLYCNLHYGVLVGKENHTKKSDTLTLEHELLWTRKNNKDHQLFD